MKRYVAYLLEIGEDGEGDDEHDCRDDAPEEVDISQQHSTHVLLLEVILQAH